MHTYTFTQTHMHTCAHTQTHTTATHARQAHTSIEDEKGRTLEGDAVDGLPVTLPAPAKGTVFVAGGSMGVPVRAPRGGDEVMAGAVGTTGVDGCIAAI